MELNEYQTQLSELDAGWTFGSSKLVSELQTNFDFTSNRNAGQGTAYVQNDCVDYKPLETMLIDLVDDLTILGEPVSCGMAMYGVKGLSTVHAFMSRFQCAESFHHFYDYNDVDIPMAEVNE